MMRTVSSVHSFGHSFGRSVACPLACLVAAWLAGCATERLDAVAPSGVNLTGEWKFNPNLSDDPDKLADPDKATPQRTPGSHRGHGGGRGGGGGMGPMGSPGGTGPGLTAAPSGFTAAPSGLTAAPSGFAAAPAGFTPAVRGLPSAASDFAPEESGVATAAGGSFVPVGLTASGIEQAAPLPPAASTPATGSAPQGRGASINRVLKPPMHLSITQKEGTLTIKTDMPDGTHTADEYTAGTSNTIPYGPDSTADRSVGWRGPVFVITTKAKQGGWREDDFALDDDGRLILTTQTKGGRIGAVEITRVYDRMRGAQGTAPSETGTPDPAR